MAKSGSIAGRAHGAKGAQPPAQEAQYRPQLTDLPGVHPEVARAMQTAFDNLYTLRGQVNALQGAQKASAAPAPVAGSGSPSPTSGGSPAASTIGGINIQAATDSASLQHGANTVYNSQTGQFEFATPAGFVPAPATAGSPGVAGQIAFDGTHFYVCTATSVWMRAAVATF